MPMLPRDDDLSPDIPRYGTSYVVGRDGSWLLLFEPPDADYGDDDPGELWWVDLAATGEAGEAPSESSAESPSGPFTDDWPPDESW